MLLYLDRKKCNKDKGSCDVRTLHNKMNDLWNGFVVMNMLEILKIKLFLVTLDPRLVEIVGT